MISSVDKCGGIWEQFSVTMEAEGPETLEFLVMGMDAPQRA